jgi:flagellar basal body-associated protein FliL
MEDQDSESDVVPVEKKKGKGALIGIVVAVVLVVSAGVAGAVMGPKFFAKQPAHQSDEEGAADEEKSADGSEESDGGEVARPAPKEFTGEVKEVTNLQPIVVDVRGADGQVRHLKISLSIEHPEATPEAAFKPYIPRAREATIAYLRTHDFEELSLPKNFERLRIELNENIIAAVGKKRAKRVLITDFVAQ